MVGGHQDLEEETKGGSSKTVAAEAPPKDNNERVERLLTKLERASQLADMEELSRELRYLEEFDLFSSAYNDDQIKRTFLVSHLKL